MARSESCDTLTEAVARAVFCAPQQNMDVIYCMSDTEVNEQVFPHNIAFSSSPALTSSPYLHKCRLVGAFFEFCDYLLLLPILFYTCHAQPPHSHSARFEFIIRKEPCDGGGGSMKGSEERGVCMGSLSRRKENDCVHVSVGTQPPGRFSVSAIDPV